MTNWTFFFFFELSVQGFQTSSKLGDVARRDERDGYMDMGLEQASSTVFYSKTFHGASSARKKRGSSAKPYWQYTLAISFG